MIKVILGSIYDLVHFGFIVNISLPTNQIVLIFLEISLPTLAVTLTAVHCLSLCPAVFRPCSSHCSIVKLLLLQTTSKCLSNMSNKYICICLEIFAAFYGFLYLFHHFLFYRDESFVCQGHGGGSVVVVV